MNTMTTSDAFDIIKSLIDNHGNNDYIGESVTQSEHFLQSATLAENNGEPDEIVVGALLHDIGHLLIFDPTLRGEIKTMGSLGVHGHENIGADFLKRLGFDQRIIKLVRNHVNAKRYLLNKDSDYRTRLSEASWRTLKYQNGIMSDQEVVEFEKDPDHKNYIKIRHLDDGGKIVGKNFRPLTHFKDTINKFIIKIEN